MVLNAMKQVALIAGKIISGNVNGVVKDSNQKRDIKVVVLNLARKHIMDNCSWRK
jgi:hypothetical protein